MKVLFNTYPMAFHTPGGGEMQLRNYQTYLSQLGIKVGLFNLWEPNFLEYDLVHFFSVFGGSSPFCRFVKQLQKPLLVTSSLWITEETKNLYPFDEIKHQLQLADRVITNSQLESQQLASVFHLPIDKFSVVYNGVDPIFFEKVSSDLFRKHFNIDYPFILNVANVEPRKNQLALLQAMQQFKDYKLVTIGHIRDERYGKKCFELGKEQFVFLGSLDHHSPLLRSAYAACDLFALPSTLETPDLAALEAAAMGAKVIVTGVGAPREYFGDLVQYVDDPENIDEIAEKVRGILSASHSNLLAEKIKQQFSWDETIKALVQIYKMICNCNYQRQEKVLCG